MKSNISKILVCLGIFAVVAVPVGYLMIRPREGVTDAALVRPPNLDQDGLLESEKETVAGLEFVALVPPIIVIGPPREQSTPIKFGLRITNRSNQAVIIPLFDQTVELRLSRKGVQQPSGGGSDWPAADQFKLLRPGKTWTIAFQGSVGRGVQSPQDGYLSFVSGGTSWIRFEPLLAGRHEISLQYRYNPQTAEEGALPKEKDGNPVWARDVVTKPVVVDVRD